MESGSQNRRNASPDRVEQLSGRELVAIGVLVLLLHAAIALLVPLPGSFGKYPIAARQLASGELAAERKIDFSPLYLGLNQAGLRLEPLLGKLETFLPWLQIGLLALAAALAAGAASRHLGRKAGAAFALLLATDRHVLAYVRMLEPEILLLALLAAWLYLLDEGERDGVVEPQGLIENSPGEIFFGEGRGEAPPYIGSPPSPSAERGAGGRGPFPVWRLAAAGTAAALAIATRPTFLPVFLLVAPLYLGFRHGFRPFGPWLRRSAIFAAPLALALLLLGWRAAAATGDFRAPAMNPGTVFYEGHQPLSTGTSARYPPSIHLAIRGTKDQQPDVGHVLYRRIAREEKADPDLPIAQVNDFWAGKAANFLRDQPALALRRAATQLRYALHAYSFHDVSQAMLYEQRLPGLLLPFSLLAAFALWGAAAAARKFKSLLLFYAILAAQLGVMTLFYVSARQRLVLLPAIIFFALVGLADLRSRGRRGVVLGLLLGVLALVLAIRDPAQQDDFHGRSAFSASLARREAITTALGAGGTLASLREEVCIAAATMASRLEDTRPADYPQDQESIEECVARQLRKELEVAGGWRRNALEFDLGGMELLLGNLEAAEQRLRPLAEEEQKFLRDGGEPSMPDFYLARIAFLKGDQEAARRELEKGLEKSPGEPFLLGDLWALTGEEKYKEQLLRYYSQLDQDWIGGRALLFYGKPEPARQELEKVVDRLPSPRRPRLELAIALAELRRDQEALGQLRIAYKGPGEPCAQASRLMPLLERLAAVAPTAEARIEIGTLLFHHGAYLRAAEMLGPALAELGPAAPPQLLKMLEQARRG
jgi:hypothetical protein